MNFFRFILFTVSITVLSDVAAVSLSERLRQAVSSISMSDDQAEILHPDEAFILDSRISGPDELKIKWQIASGYYLYRDKFTFAVLEGSIEIDRAHIDIPPGKTKDDPTFGTVEVNTGDIDITLPLVRTSTGETTILLQVGYQGCKDNSICYPPIKKQLNISLPVSSSGAVKVPGTMAISGSAAGKLSAQDLITERLKSGGVLLNIIAFLGFGLLLSLTPCIFPMIPILSGIIVGKGTKITGLQAFFLSLSYVLAMAATYAVLGVIAGSFHFNLQVASQNALIISLFSAVFVVLALSMFGLYELQLPAAVQNVLISTSNKQQGGSISGAAIMGSLSAVIVGPCVAPPLAGALLYISQTGNAVLGGVALFAMGLGLGAPLLVIGGSAGALLPRAGAWMETIKKSFGVVMIGVAIWFMDRVLPGQVTVALWGILFTATSIFMGVWEKTDEVKSNLKRCKKLVALLLLVYGIVLLLGAAAGSKDVLKPLAGLVQTGELEKSSHAINFKRIKSLADLDQELSLAAQKDKVVILDFYADWCITCIEMEKHTFTVPRVRTKMEEFILLQADVTDNDQLDQELLKEFQIYGPPAILFFGSDMREMQASRLVGFVKADVFLEHLDKVSIQ